MIFLSLGMMVPLQAGSIRISGYYKNFIIFFSMPDFFIGGKNLDSNILSAVNNRFRLRMTIEPWQGVEFRLAYDLSPRIQDPLLFNGTLFSPGIVSPGYRIADFRDRIVPYSQEGVHSFGLFHNLDRFMVMKRFKWADLFIGRQVIAWGSARLINPTDIIAPFSFNQLDTEERRGVDAVRLRIPLGMMDELDFGFVGGTNLDREKSAFFTRGKFYFLHTDFSLLLLGFRQHLMLGLDIARSIGEMGLWIESAWINPFAFDEDENRADERSYFRLSGGMDYNLTPKTYGYIEYHFSSAGKKNPESYLKFFQSSAYKDGSVYLMSRHYIGAGLTYQLSPLIPVSILALFNLNDLSFMVSPSMEYNILENIYLSAGAYIGIGNEPEYLFQISSISEWGMKSEFGTYPDMVFTSFRIYF